jgi:hypothetical protein
MDLELVQSVLVLEDHVALNVRGSRFSNFKTEYGVVVRKEPKAPLIIWTRVVEGENPVFLRGFTGVGHFGCLRSHFFTKVMLGVWRYMPPSSRIYRFHQGRRVEGLSHNG